MEEVWYVIQVVWFVVVVIDMGEDVNYFQVVLYVYQVVGMEEVFEVWWQWDVGLGCFFLVMVQCGMYVWFWLIDEGVFVQVGDIVGDWVVQGVLEVEDVWVGFVEYQIVWYIVVMDEYLWLFQCVVYQQVVDLFLVGQCFVFQFYVEVVGQVLVGEQLQFVVQYCFVVGRQDIGDIDFLEGDQCIQGWFEQFVGIFGMKYVEVGLLVQVIEQQEIVFQILGENFWYMYVGFGEQFGDFDEWLVVFLGWWCVYYYQVVVFFLLVEIMMEVGVVIGWDQFGGGYFFLIFGNE